MSLDTINKVNEIAENIKIPEKILGKGLLQPFNRMNSSSRKLMFSSQLEQVLPLIQGELPDITTGYEAEYGRHSSSLIKAEEDYEVIGLIPKFLDNPYHIYLVVFKSKEGNRYTVIERIGHTHITESYGYLLDNSELDKLNPGDTVKKGTSIQKSKAFDKSNNRMDGINLQVAYMSPNKTTEDGIIISKSAADKLTSPLIDKVKIIINDNDIPLNLYGDAYTYKSFPDINEDVKNGILCGIRRDRKEDSLFTQSYSRLSDIMISDEKYTVDDGKIVDINIFCNNPDNLNASYYNTQLAAYHNMSMDYHRRIVNALASIIKDPNNNCSYQMKKLFHNSDRIVAGDKFKNDKVFSNIILEITVLRNSKLNVGDKLTDRYGGKGVVSEVRPDELMPVLGDNTPIDIIFNVFGCVNRENPGQLAEVSTTFISKRFTDYLETIMYVPGVDYQEVIDEYCNFVNEFSPKMAEWVKNVFNDMSCDEEKAALLDSFIKDGIIKLSLEPLSESMSLDKLDSIYQKYPWIWNSPHKVRVPIRGSNGTYRYVEALRSLYSGRKYIYRLKQYAKDKFSATSLSSTNIRNEPTKSKANKNYKSPYTKTPIRFGEMETGDMEHLDVLTVVKNLMLHSNSPLGRRETKDLYTQDPFNINVEIGENAVNRNVEILNVYLKTMGLRIIFKKIPIKLVCPFEIRPFTIEGEKEEDRLMRAFEIVKEDVEIKEPFEIVDPLQFYSQETLDIMKEYPSINAVCLEDADGNVAPFYIVPGNNNKN